MTGGARINPTTGLIEGSPAELIAHAQARGMHREAGVMAVLYSRGSLDRFLNVVREAEAIMTPRLWEGDQA